MTDWAKLTGYDPASGMTLEEHLAEVRAKCRAVVGVSYQTQCIGCGEFFASRELPQSPPICGACRESLSDGTEQLVPQNPQMLGGLVKLGSFSVAADSPSNPDDLLRVNLLNPAIEEYTGWAPWEPTDEERTRELVELQKYLTSPPAQAPWTYITLQVSGGDVIGVHRPPADED